MSVRHAMLGLLEEQPDYGYRLKRRFDQRVGEVWRLNLGQVYQALKSLEDDELIRRVNDDGEDDDAPVPRRRFELTRIGAKRLEAWLRRKPTSPRPLRDELLIHLLVLARDRKPQALERVDNQEQVYRRHLARLQARKRKVSDTADGAELVASLGLEAAISHTVAHLKWLEYCRMRLAALRPRDHYAARPVPVPARLSEPR